MTRTGSFVSWPLDAHTDRFFRSRGEGNVGMGGSGVRTSFPTGPNTFSGFGFERVFSPAEILNIPDTSSLRQDLAVIFEQLGQLAIN